MGGGVGSGGEGCLMQGSHRATVAGSLGIPLKRLEKAIDRREISGHLDCMRGNRPLSSASLSCHLAPPPSDTIRDQQLIWPFVFVSHLSKEKERWAINISISVITNW